jgi:hypothetical protein
MNNATGKCMRNKRKCLVTYWSRRSLAIAYLGLLEDSRDVCEKTAVGQVGWDEMNG